MSDVLILDRQCPKCKTSKIVSIIGNRLECGAEECDFSVQFSCPVCSGDLESNQCIQCKVMITDRKIKHLIDNSLIVDHESKCKLCNGPTLHRPGANLGHRCFHFPRCSGQAGLFGDVRTSYVFLDFETSGLEVHRDSIIEIGALKIDDEGFEHVFQQFIKPPDPIGAHITQITGITNEMLENSPVLSDVIHDFVAFVGDAKLVAHNAEFDIPWLIRSIMENNIPLPANDVICTLKWARRAKEPRAGLGALTKKYKISHENAHRALADACSTRELFLIFENQYAAEKQIETIRGYKEFSEKILQQG